MIPELYQFQLKLILLTGALSSVCVTVYLLSLLDCVSKEPKYIAPNQLSLKENWAEVEASENWRSWPKCRVILEVKKAVIPSEMSGT